MSLTLLTSTFDCTLQVVLLRIQMTLMKMKVLKRNQQGKNQNQGVSVCVMQVLGCSINSPIFISLISLAEKIGVLYLVHTGMGRRGLIVYFVDALM